ncbi:unnamed protein product [Durusdinium trenchii]|uniref:Uncharacterized protein n=1 Tax=Durusdinium trenchii TaxID=1381693 RepID=A0ABP0HWH9_9DINO
MADSDDEMPPLEYVGTGVTGGNPVTASIEPDDDMPPLEYVGTDASLGISLREGDRVILKGLSKAALNGQTGTLQSFQKASKGRLPVKLDSSGSMLAVKPENIQKLPRETVTTKATKMNPDFGVATAKATHADRNATYSAPDEDDELPPLEYVGTCDISSRPNGVSNDAKVEDDEMPSLEYFGSKPPRIGGAEGCTDEKTKEEMPENSTNSSNSTFRDGDQVLIKGTLTELDGQQGVIESIRDGSFQVKLERNHKNVAKLAHGKLLQNLAEANLHKIWLRGSGAGAMPPLQFVGQANGSVHNSSVPNGHDAKEPERKSGHCEGNMKEIQEILQRMRSALHASSLPEVDVALGLDKPGLHWGGWEAEKSQIVKQLAAQRSGQVHHSEMVRGAAAAARAFIAVE